MSIFNHKIKAKFYCRCIKALIFMGRNSAYSLLVFFVNLRVAVFVACVYTKRT